MLTPDFGSSSFPIQSVCTSHSFSASSNKPLRRRVSFAVNLTDEYEIPSRYCRRSVPINIEQLWNQVRRLRRELQEEYEILDEQDRIEFALEVQYLYYLRFTDVVTMVKLKNSIERLRKRYVAIQDGIEFLRIDMIRIKGALKSMEARNHAKRADESPYGLVRALWFHAWEKINSIEA